MSYAIVITSSNSSLLLNKELLMKKSEMINRVLSVKSVDQFDFPYISDDTLQYFKNYVEDKQASFQIKDRKEGIMFASILQCLEMKQTLEEEEKYEVFFTEFKETGKITFRDYSDSDLEMMKDLLSFCKGFEEMYQYLMKIYRRSVTVGFIFEKGFGDHWKRHEDVDYCAYIERKARKYFLENERSCIDHALQTLSTLDEKYDVRSIAEKGVEQFCVDRANEENLSKYLPKKEKVWTKAKRYDFKVSEKEEGDSGPEEGYRKGIDEMEKKMKKPKKPEKEYIESDSE